jgi:hypothetical protein
MVDPSSSNARSKRADPPKEAWLFGDRKLLPEDETVAACYWEFGLETPDVIKEVQQLRKRQQNYQWQCDTKAVTEWCSANPKPENDPAGWIEWMRRFRGRFPNDPCTAFRDFNLQFLRSWPEFPGSHWLEIAERAQKSRDKRRLCPPNQGWLDQDDWDNPLRREESRGTFYAVPAFFFKTECGIGCYEEIYERIRAVARFTNSHTIYSPTTKTPGGAATDDRWTEYRLFRFSWSRSDRKLRADFAEWLKENRPDDLQPYHKSNQSDSRRTTERDLLKALGATRLLRHFNGDWQAAADYSSLFCRDKRGNPKPLYVEQSEWRDTKNRAEKALKDFHMKAFSRKVFE